MCFIVSIFIIKKIKKKEVKKKELTPFVKFFFHNKKRRIISLAILLE
jgi:hypothetical protein